MKKILFTLFALLSAGMINAQDEVQVVPANITAGSVATLSVNLNNPSFDNELQTITIDIVWPEGWTVSAPSLNQERVATYDPDFEEYGDNNFAVGKSSVTEESGEVATRYLVYSSNKTPMNGSTGTIFTVKVKAPAGTAEGIYPIKIVGTHYMTKDTNTEHNIDLGESTSYIKVGAPTAATLAVEGVVPSFVTSALSSESTKIDLDLTAATKINGTLDFGNIGISAVGEGVVVENAYYERASNNEYGTICLPFDGNAKNGEIYEIGAVDSKYIHLAEPSNEVKAGVPAFYKGNQLTVNAENVTLQPLAADKYLTGVYTQTNVTEADAYYLKGDKLVKCNGNFNVAPFRAYVSVALGEANIRIADPSTGIQEVEAAAQGSAIYNVAGMRLSKAQKGVNIVDGKKVVVK